MNISKLESDHPLVEVVRAKVTAKRKNQVKNICKKLKWNESEFVRKAIEEFIERNENDHASRV